MSHTNVSLLAKTVTASEGAAAVSQPLLTQLRRTFKSTSLGPKHPVHTLSVLVTPPRAINARFGRVMTRDDS